MNDSWLLVLFVVFLLIALGIALYPLRQSRSIVFLLTPLMFGFLAFGYWHWGAWPGFKNYMQQQARHEQIKNILQSVRDPEELIDKLAAQLRQHPDSARGWYLLGRLYASQEKWQQAYDVYLKAHQLQPENEQITVNYAQSVWQLNHQHFDDSTRTLLLSVLQKNQNQPDALAMLAMDAFLRHAYQQAIDYWQRLLKIAPPQSADAIAIRKAIAKAQQKML